MSVGLESCVGADRQRQHILDVAKLKARDHRNTDHRADLSDHCVQVVAIVVVERSAAGKIAEHERLLSRQEGAGKRQAPILEINPDHALIGALAARATSGSDIDDAAFVLYGQARIVDGEKPDDPADFARRIDRLLERSL